MNDREEQYFFKDIMQRSCKYLLLIIFPGVGQVILGTNSSRVESTSGGFAASSPKRREKYENKIDDYKAMLDETRDTINENKHSTLGILGG